MQQQQLCMKKVPITSLQHTVEYNRNYLRNSIIALMRYKKPIIVTGSLVFQPYEYYYSFIDIKPFCPQYENQLRILCSHVNISKKQVDAVLNLYGNKNYTQKPLVLICKPYTYRIQTNSEDRGGLNLTAELGIPGIMTYENALISIPKIDKQRYVDFSEFAGGYFLGIDPIQEKQQKSQRKHERKILNLKQKKEEDNNLLFTTKDGLTVTNDKPIFKFDNPDNLNISYMINKLQLPNTNKKSKIANNSVLEGWFLRI